MCKKHYLSHQTHIDFFLIISNIFIEIPNRSRLPYSNIESHFINIHIYIETKTTKLRKPVSPMSVCRKQEKHNQHNNQTE
jgi:hypothetical protein